MLIINNLKYRNQFLVIDKKILVPFLLLKL